MTSKILITIDEKKLRELVVSHLCEKMGEVYFDPKDIKIEVKSAQNYKAEWENAEFRATIETLIL